MYVPALGFAGDGFQVNFANFLLVVLAIYKKKCIRFNFIKSIKGKKTRRNGVE